MPGTPWGDLGTQGTGRSLETATATALEEGGPSSDTTNQQYARAPPPTQGGGGRNTSDTTEQQHEGPSVTDVAEGGRTREVGVSFPPRSGAT